MVDRILGEIQFSSEQVEHRGPHVRAYFEADGLGGTLAEAQDRLHCLEEVVGFLLFHRKVGTAGHPEGEVVDDFHTLEEPAEVSCDHLLDREQTVLRRRAR